MVENPYPRRSVQQAEATALAAKVQTAKQIADTYTLAVMETAAGRFLVQRVYGLLTGKLNQGAADLPRANYERCAVDALRALDAWLAEVPAELMQQMKDENR